MNWETILQLAMTIVAGLGLFWRMSIGYAELSVQMARVREDLVQNREEHRRDLAQHREEQRKDAHELFGKSNALDVRMATVEAVCDAVHGNGG